MTKIHSHYENLKVARDAPPEVIRAAYRSLSQKYHPDRNPGDAQAAQRMTLINAAYDVLSDPLKRKEHDNWIAAVEVGNAEPVSEPRNTNSSNGGTASAVNSSKLRTSPSDAQSYAYKGARVFAHVRRNWFWYGFGAFVFFGWINDKPRTPPPGPKPYVATPAPAPTTPAYVRPSAAPNGQRWPLSAGYVKDYQRLHAGGLSTVTVDNSRNDSDVFVKLVSLSGAQAYPVRQFYIPASGSFTLNKVTAGTYDIRYRDLGTGGLARSESFAIEEVKTSGGIQFSKFTMTLYKVRDGNMRTFGLAEGEF